ATRARGAASARLRGALPQRAPRLSQSLASATPSPQRLPRLSDSLASTMDPDEGGGLPVSRGRDRAHAVPARRQARPRPAEDPLGVDGREVDAAAALRLAEAVVPVGA